MSELYIDAIVPGLSYITEVIDRNYELTLMNYLNNSKWEPVTVDAKNSRLVQHYGYKYSYVTKDLYPAEPIPDIFKPLLDILKKLYPEIIFDQCIVNNYLSGQSISQHKDSNIFGPVICCFSICKPADIKFVNDATGSQHVVNLPPRSLYIMEGPARSIWKHEMPAQKITRRISITFRSVRYKL